MKDAILALYVDLTPFRMCDEIAGKECKQAVKNENTSLVTCLEKYDQPPLLALSIISHKLIRFGHKQS